HILHRDDRWRFPRWWDFCHGHGKDNLKAGHRLLPYSVGGLGSISFSSSYSSLSNSARRRVLSKDGVNVEVVVGGSSFALGSGIGDSVEKPGGPTDGATDCANMDMIRLL
ncbi:hypothetical protein Tco_0496779, partial [Tanacetum coccineum]